jgi:hypothetical protein
VSKIEVQRRGVTTVLERRPEEGEDLIAGTWHLTAPIEAEADPDQVELLMSELEWLDARRRLEDVSADDRKRFGFDKPRFRVWVTVGRERVPLVVGKLTPQEDGLYVRGRDESVAFVVGKDLAEMLDKEPTDYHTKELHDGVTAFLVTELRVRDEGGEWRIVQRDERFHIEAPIQASASKSEVRKALDAIGRLRAKRFIAAKLDDAARFGLDAPWLEIHVAQRHIQLGDAGASKKRTGQPPIDIAIGNPCEGHEGERYARVNQGPVHCVLEADLADVRRPIEAFAAADAGLSVDAGSPVDAAAPRDAAPPAP